MGRKECGSSLADSQPDPGFSPGMSRWISNRCKIVSLFRVLLLDRFGVIV